MFAGLEHWLLSLPLDALYLAMGVIAAIENIFPPVPADVVVGFGAFVAARGHGAAWAGFLAVWVGNVTGAMLMYYVGRRFGAEPLERRLLGERGPVAEARIRTLYGHYGLGAIFLSRFIPGVRAVVPPVCGALHVPPVRTATMIGFASAIWYGSITYVGFAVGADWAEVQRLLKEYGVIAALVALGLGLAGIIAWRVQRRGGKGRARP
jgi:membrane protein DedA with SNARE-associated domain